jgi:glycosyltransferase involved in cell wall biosynthesis
MKLIVIVPAYNEARIIRKVLRSLIRALQKIGYFEIVVVDDGSQDNTGQEARREKVTVLTHPINRGLGGALGTGLSYAKTQNFDIAVTFDADGQHCAADIKKVIRPLIKKQADVVIGSRTLKGGKQIPWDRRLIIWGSNLVTYFFFGIRSSDSQSGFRAFSSKALQKIKIKTQGMEVSSEFYGEIKRNRLRLAEVPIKVIYTPYSRKKGQSNLNALQVLFKLLLRLSR